MLVLVGSVLSAGRYARVMENITGIPASVIHTPAELGGSGCSYSVRLNDKFYSIARKAALENNIQIKKIYGETFAEGKRVYNALP